MLLPRLTSRRTQLIRQRIRIKNEIAAVLVGNLKGRPRPATCSARRDGHGSRAWCCLLMRARRYMVNELEMSSEDVAIALGHQDGGNLVRRLYRHRDNGRALDGM